MLPPKEGKILLCGVEDRPIRLELLPPFAGLDSKFNMLRKSQRRYTQLVEKLQRHREKASVGGEAVADEVSTPKFRSRVSELIDSIRQLQSNIDDLIQPPPASDFAKMNGQLEEILKYKAQKHTKELDSIQEQFEDEITAYTEQIQLLKAAGATPADCKPSDFNTIKRYLEGKDLPVRSAILHLFYSLQLRKYQTIKADLAERREDIEKAQRATLKVGANLTTITPKLLKEYEEVSKLERELSVWEERKQSRSQTTETEPAEGLKDIVSLLGSAKNELTADISKVRGAKFVFDELGARIREFEQDPSVGEEGLYSALNGVLASIEADI